MSVVQIESRAYIGEVSFQEHEVVLNQILGLTNALQLAYQEYEVERVGVADIDTRESGTVTMNVLPTPLYGKVYLFDGVSITEIGTPVAVIFPALASMDKELFMTGGLEEGGGIPDKVYGFGVEASQLLSDKKYVGFVIADADVYVLDDQSKVRTVIRNLGATPIYRGWRLVSRKPFTAIVMEVKEE